MRPGRGDSGSDQVRIRRAGNTNRGWPWSLLISASWCCRHRNDRPSGFRRLPYFALFRREPILGM